MNWWRKALHSFRRTAAFRFAAACALLAAAKTAAVDFPTMPAVTAPSMPELSDSSPFQQTKPAGTGAAETDKKKTSPNVTALQIANLGGLNALGSLDSLSSSGALGSLDSLESLTGSGRLTDYLSALTELTRKTAAAAGSTADTGKTAPDTAAATASAASAAKTAAAASAAPGATATLVPEASAQPQSRVLRFKVNGADILGTCSTLYFSEPAASGIFLLTGDRTVVSRNRKYAETFYLLFKPQETSGGAIRYDVEADIMQETDNSASYLYLMTQKSPFTALRTGNLVSLRANDADWKLDLLIDLREDK